MHRKWPGLAGAAAIASVALAGGAHAADLYTPPPVYPPAPAYVFNWTGFYVGAHAGYGWGDADVKNKDDFLYDFSPDIDGPFVGVQGGYNHQIGSIVLGLEADVSWADIDGKESTEFAGPFFGDTTVKQEIEWLGTVRGRVGWAIGEIMPYVTGGFAWARSERTSSWDGGDFPGGASSPAKDKNTHTGWVIGGGVEWAFTQNVTAKLEYQYLDLGSETYELDLGAPFSEPRVDFDLHTVRLGVNFLF